MAAPKAWLSIGIGDKAQDERDQASWHASTDFLQAKHKQLGLPSSHQECSEEQLEMAQEAFLADPHWASQAGHDGGLHMARSTVRCRQHSCVMQGMFMCSTPAGVCAGRLTLLLDSPVRSVACA